MPAGARQADCEPATDRLADGNVNDLWAACEEPQQESLSVRFLQTHQDLLRDALLDVQTGSPRQRRGGAWLGEIVWQIWIGYRDRELRAMRRRGDFSRS